MLTRVFKSGNSLAVRIPKELGFVDGAQVLRPTIDSSRPPTLSRVEFGPVSHAIFEGARTSL